MKKLLKAGVLAFALLAPPPMLEAALSVEFPFTAAAWYDIDGDGRLEYIDGENKAMFRLDSNNAPQMIKSFTYRMRTPKIARMGAGLPLIIYDTNIWNSNLYSIQEDFSTKQIELPNVATANSSNYSLYYPVEFRGDGSKGIISHDKYGNTEFNIAYTLDSDGNYQSDELSVITWNEYKDIRSKLVLSDGGGIPSVAQGMFVGTDGGTSYGDLRSLDLNGDGLSDIFDAAGGRYYLNTGLGSFVQNTFGGKVTVRDLNADGIADFIVYDEEALAIRLVLSDGPDSSREVELLQGYRCNERIWCYDFDNDGDIDILVPLDCSTDQQSNDIAFLVYYENDGKGNFKKTENWIDGACVRFFDCIDFDSDGKYEIIAIKMPKTYGYYEFCMYEIAGKKIPDNPEIILSSPEVPNNWEDGSWSNAQILPINLANTGFTSIVVAPGGVYTPHFIHDFGTINQRPNAPGKPKYMFNREEGTLKVFWDSASDAETPTADLTYEIRVGTAPGLDDVVAVDALSDGRRRTTSLGANGHQLYRTFNVSGWPAGKYYISVQAVDPNMLGSVFSEETVFDKELPATNFAIDAPDNISVNDEIALRLIGSNKQAKDVTWNIDGGEMLGANADKSECRIRFTVPGRKNISVSVTGSNDIRSVSKERSFEIRNAKVDSIGTGPLSSIIGVFDIDTDGSEEYLTTKIFEQNEAGELNQVRKMYNTNLSVSNNITPVDNNRDGLVDFLNYSSYYFYIWSNNGDKDIDFSEKYKFDEGYDKFFVDMDNDGTKEAIFWNSGYIAYYKFSEDFKNYTLFNRYSLTTKPIFIEDYNGDGLPDIFWSKTTDEIHYTEWGSQSVSNYYISYNLGNMTFDEGHLIPNYNYYIEPALVGDFDNDGKLDVVYSEYGGYQYFHYSESVIICYGNGHIVEVKCPDGNPFGETIGAFDFDNNGMKDLIIALKNGQHTHTIYMNSDYTYAMSDSGHDIWGKDLGVFHRNDGSSYIYNKQIHNIANERPTAPGEIRHSVNEEFVNIEWSAASDKETPAPGLQYNISIKKKGTEGEGAYLLSPMNMGKDNVSVPSGHRLLNAPRIAIPLSSIPAGEYEVKVQAVDGQRVTGPFSPTYTMAVPQKAVLDAPTSVYTGEKVTVRLIGNIVSPELDFGPDATVEESTIPQYYDATWSESGMKILKVNGEAVATLMVYDAPDVDFTLPEMILEGATVTVDCVSAKKGTWEIVTNGKALPIIESPRTSGVSIADGEIVFTISGREDFAIRHTVDEGFGSTTAEHTASVDSNNARPAIDRVALNSDGNANEIFWSAASMPAGTEMINVYRETSRINQYDLLCIVPVADGRFTDQTSLPKVKAARYAISFQLPYGESALSEVHQTMHLQLNRGWNDAINLMWSKYEGRPVMSYEIYGGNSEDALQLIDAVSGNLTSYTADGTMAYYAVSVVFGDSSAASRAGLASSRSNIAATAEASSAILATGLNVTTADGSDEIDLDEINTLQLMAYLSPTGVSVSRIDWYISKGADLAKVSENGLVTAYKPGEITVNAVTRDGSGISVSIDITIVGDYSGVEEIVSGCDGGDSVIMVVSLNGTVVFNGQKDIFYNDVYPRLARGIYIIKSSTATSKIKK